MEKDNKKEIEEQQIEDNNLLVFVCNSETDGFKEGDGDLMDKLMISLNKINVKAIRVIMYEKDVPLDRKQHLKEGSIVCLQEKRDPFGEYNLKKYRENFKNLVTSEKYKNANKVVYIGSRLDWEEKSSSYGNNKELVLKQSGALFDKNLMQFLKESEIKTIVCCLELEFFMRSKRTLRVGFEMLKQQILLADGIHFLTEKDKEYFGYLFKDLLKENSILRCIDAENLKFDSRKTQKKAVEALKLNTEEQNFYDFNNTEFKNFIGNNKLIDEILENRSIYSPGIYTVDPIVKPDNIKKESFIEDFLNRKRNIVQFGMIRAEKGIDESLQLADKLKEANYDNLYIIGRVREIKILRHLITQCYVCNEEKSFSQNKKRHLEIEIHSIENETTDSLLQKIK